MTSYRFLIELGDFSTPDDWIVNTAQRFETTIEAESLSKATKIIEERFGGNAKCRYRFNGDFG